MCPVLRDMWGILGFEARHVSGAEGHVGRWGRGSVGKRFDEGWGDFGGIVAGLL